MSGRLELALEVAREAGGLQRRRFDEPRTIETKSSPIDLVTDVDRACDELIRKRILARFPEDGLLTEEQTEHPGRSDWRWVVDPLDGTTNYAHGFPHFAVSIAAEFEGETRVGVIFDPLRDELFSAELGGGAARNGRPIRVSDTGELQRCLLGTGFAYDVHSSEDDNLAHFRRFMKRVQAVRRAGSAALDLAYVACGRYDGFWELNLHPWDVAAGLLLVREAGGRTSDFDGGPVPSSGRRVLASNGRVHAAMLEVISA
ncbi:MAG: inositol monophosphatase [Proteobacteria bacterium]|nr:inositol monophosphatase [Pseudomonadota bacterium]